MSEPSVRSFAARFAELPALLEAARVACDEAGFDAAATRRVELVLEEAFSNSIRHGYGGECDASVWIAFAILPDGLEIVYEDAASPFDPLQGATLPEDGRVGGVGRVLMKTIPCQVAYERRAGRNRLHLRFNRLPAST